MISTLLIITFGCLVNSKEVRTEMNLSRLGQLPPTTTCNDWGDCQYNERCHLFKGLAMSFFYQLNLPDHFI